MMKKEVRAREKVKEAAGQLRWCILAHRSVSKLWAVKVEVLCKKGDQEVFYCTYCEECSRVADVDEHEEVDKE